MGKPGLGCYDPGQGKLARSWKRSNESQDYIKGGGNSLVAKSLLTSQEGLYSVQLLINPSAWGHLNPSSYCEVGRLSYGVFKLWSKLQRKK